MSQPMEFADILMRATELKRKAVLTGRSKHSTKQENPVYLGDI